MSSQRPGSLTTPKLAQLKMNPYQNSRNQKCISNLHFTNAYKSRFIPLSFRGLKSVGFSSVACHPFYRKIQRKSLQKNRETTAQGWCSRVLSKEETFIPLLHKTSMASAGYWKGSGWSEGEREIIWDLGTFREQQRNSRARGFLLFPIKNWYSQISLASLIRFNSPYQLKSPSDTSFGKSQACYKLYSNKTWRVLKMPQCKWCSRKRQAGTGWKEKALFPTPKLTWRLQQPLQLSK